MSKLDNEKDLFIKQKIQEDKLISKKADDLFNNFKKGEFLMEEKFEKTEPTKDNVVNNVKKTTKWKKILATAASLVIVTGAANVYATTNGYGNVFFLIKYLVTGDKSVVAGKDEILFDRDITISYETIKLTENLRMQIRSFRVKENEAKLTVVVHEENLETDTKLIPLRYKVYNSSNKLLCDQRSAKVKDQYLSEYTEELSLNNYKQEDSTLVLEVYKSNDEKLAKITINLNTREITVDGEQEAIQKVSEIELKKYLGFISAFEEVKKSNDDGKIHFAEAILSNIKDVEPYDTNNGIAYKVSDVNGTLESMGYEKVSDSFKKGDLFQRRTIGGTEYFGVLSPTGGFNPNAVIEITNISYCAGLYTAEFSYVNIIEDDSFTTDYSKVDKKIATVYFKVNEDDKYSKFKVVKYVKGKDEVSSIQENTTTVQEENNLPGEWLYVLAKLNGKEVEMSNVFGSGIRYGTGNIVFSADGTFSNNKPGVSSSEFSNSGTYTVNGSEITLEYSDNRTEKLTYKEQQRVIEQKYGEYVLTLKRSEEVMDGNNNTNNTNTANSTASNTTKTNTSTNNTMTTNTTNSNNTSNTNVTNNIISTAKPTTNDILNGIKRYLIEVNNTSVSSSSKIKVTFRKYENGDTVKDIEAGTNIFNSFLGKINPIISSIDNSTTYNDWCRRQVPQAEEKFLMMFMYEGHQTHIIWDSNNEKEVDMLWYNKDIKTIEIDKIQLNSSAKGMFEDLMKIYGK